MLVCALVAGGALLAAGPVLAGTYDVNICRTNVTGNLPGWSHTETAGTNGGLPYWYQSQNCGGYGVYRRFQINTLPNGATNDWTFTAPLNTTVSSFYHDGTATPTGAGAYDAIFAYSPAGKQALAIASSSFTWNGQPTSSSIGTRLFSMPANTSQVQLQVGCAASSCPGTDATGGYANAWMWAGGYVRLNDNFTPTVESVVGAGWQAAPIDGAGAVDFRVADRGAGVRKVRFLVDGIERQAHLADCELAGTALVPCPLSVSGSFTLDTTQLSEGVHVVALTVEDASGNATTEADQTKTVTVRRRPGVVSGDAGVAAASGPTITGATDPFTVGEQVLGNRGTWSGTGNSYVSQWQRCDAAGETCSAITEATNTSYTATTADVDHTLVFCVTATNTGGSTTRCSDPSAKVQADLDGDHIPDGIDSCPTAAATTTNGCPAAADAAGSPNTFGIESGSGGGASTATGRGAANGTNAADGARLTAVMSNRASTMKVGYGKKATVSGRLLTPDGGAIAGARLTVQRKLKAVGAAFADVGFVTTSTDGRFKFVAPAGPSRTLRFAYKAFEKDRSFSSTTDVLVLVKGALSLRAPKTVGNKKKALFSGVVKGRPIPARGVLVDLQVLLRKKWRTFATPRTNSRGVYRFKYRFTQGAATWRFRARNRHDSAHPYELAYSRRVTVRVLP